MTSREQPAAVHRKRWTKRRSQAFVPVPHRGAWTAADARSFQEQETSIILLNLLILAGLLLTHVAFRAELGPPSRVVVLAFAVRFAMQVVELILLQCREQPLTTSVARAYAVVSIWVHVGFASLVSILATGEDTHYTVLMVIPVIAAAFRFTLAGSLGVVAVAGCLTILEVWLYFHTGGAAGTLAEYFEAATMILVYLVVAVVVWLLTRHLRQERQRLATALSELEAARDRLVAEERLAAVGRLSSAVAHEIRNPVAMIASSLAMAHQSRTSPAVQEEMFAIATKEAARLERLTSDFLTYAHSKAPQRRSTAPCTTLEYVADLAKAHAAEAGVTIAVACETKQPLQIDEFQIHQALLNLVRNAVEASPSGGTVTLGARARVDAGADFYVENTGKPIAIDLVERMFEPFVSEKPSGTGLGLAITRSIARAHGGDVVLESNLTGRVRFALCLPEAEPTS